MLNSIVGLLGNGGGATNSYESIQTVTLTGSQSSIDFTSIPSTYKHLQIRMSYRSSLSDNSHIRFNGDTGSNYAWHELFGTGSSAGAGAGASATFGKVGYAEVNPGVAVIDILDYQNTSKYKTVRSLNGSDNNGSGYILLRSSLWQSTTAISSINIFPASGTLSQYSSFALYGIKG
jgi:hypothetical protein